MWKPLLPEVFGDRYDISDEGIIRAYKWRKGMRREEGRYVIKKPFVSALGYVYQRLMGKNYAVHRLVAETFIGDPTGMDVHHIDGDKANNIVENLEIMTHKENTQSHNRKPRVRSEERWKQYEAWARANDAGISKQQIAEIAGVTAIHVCSRIKAVRG